MGDRLSGLSESLESDAPLEQRFRAVIAATVKLYAEDKVFARLLHRELLDGDGARLEFVAKSVFQGPFGQFVDLLSEFETGLDPELLASLVTCSIIGHFEFHQVRRNYRGYKPPHDDPDVVANTVCEFLLNGLLVKNERG